jgi:hypothetical protein
MKLLPAGFWKTKSQMKITQNCRQKNNEMTVMVRTIEVPL